MKKADRKIIFEKFGGRCAYCGCVLEKGWHVDEIEPCRRKRKIIRGHWSEGWHKDMSEKDMQEWGIVWIEEKTVNDGYENPDALHIDNQNPACPSCNINKHSQPLEAFRDMIAMFIQSLNKYSVQYKFAKRYGLVEETNKPVVFFFEMLNKEKTRKCATQQNLIVAVQPGNKKAKHKIKNDEQKDRTNIHACLR